MVESITISDVQSGGDRLEAQEAADKEAMDSFLKAENQGDEPTESYRPEKFKSNEEWRKGYDELQKRFSQEPKSNEEDQDGDSDSLSIEETSDQPDTFSLDTYSKELAETGKLAEDSYKALESKGISRTIVDQHIQGVQALGKAFGETIKNTVGGDEAYKSMAQWAKTNYSPEQLQAYNSAVESGNMAQAQLAAKALKADYIDAVGSKPNMSVASDVSGSGNQGDKFESPQQLVQAMSDPRYEKDPAYRKSLEQKLHRSNIF